MIFFITVFRYFLLLFYSFHCLYFPFPRDADSRKGSLCLFVYPFKKKTKKNTFASDRLDRLPVSSVLSLVLLSHVDQLAWKQYG